MAQRKKRSTAVLARHPSHDYELKVWVLATNPPTVSWELRDLAAPEDDRRCGGEVP